MPNKPTSGSATNKAIALRKLRRALQKKEDPIPKALRNAGGKKKRGKKAVQEEPEPDEDLGSEE